MSEQHHEIVIVRHGGHGDHDEHHGGVWKIAFADFMTAMMAFFLVLWLISANDKTRASVARYFNPVRLVDATTQPRGLHDSKKDDSGITASPDTKTTKDDKKAESADVSKAEAAPPGAKGQETPKGREKRLDAELRDNPYVALAEIVGDKGPGEPTAKDGNAPTPAIGHGGAAFRDPFAPPPPQRLAADPDDDTLDPSQPTSPAAPSPAKEQKRSDKTETGAKTANGVGEQRVAALKTSLITSLQGLGADHAGPALDVRKTSEGTLVSLTDTSDFAMFATGSAVPSKKVVLMMERMAPVLKAQHGEIIVRGFTDNKKFRGSRYDNWHLSIDRAQVAHYMLVRGGLADTRISHVEGYADHETKIGLDPSDPPNRRIEILIKDAPA